MAEVEKVPKMKKKRRRKTIKRAELCRLAFCNSDRLPQVINDDGRRKRWVGIGWVDEGKATGTEVRMID